MFETLKNVLVNFPLVSRHSVWNRDVLGVELSTNLFWRVFVLILNLFNSFMPILFPYLLRFAPVVCFSLLLRFTSHIFRYKNKLPNALKILYRNEEQLSEGLSIHFLLVIFYYLELLKSINNTFIINYSKNLYFFYVIYIHAIFK